MASRALAMALGSIGCRARSTGGGTAGCPRSRPRPASGGGGRTGVADWSGPGAGCCSCTAGRTTRGSEAGSAPGCGRVDDRLDPPGLADHVDRGLTKDLLAPAAHERVAGAGVDQRDGERLVVDRGDLGVLAEQDPGVAALELDRVEQVGPEPADLDETEAARRRGLGRRGLLGGRGQSAAQARVRSARAVCSGGGCGCLGGGLTRLRGRGPGLLRGGGLDRLRVTRLGVTGLRGRARRILPWRGTARGPALGRRGAGGGCRRCCVGADDGAAVCGSGAAGRRTAGACCAGAADEGTPPSIDIRFSMRSIRASTPSVESSAPGSSTSAQISSSSSRGAVAPRISVSPAATRSAARVRSCRPNRADCATSRPGPPVRRSGRWPTRPGPRR